MLPSGASSQQTDATGPLTEAIASLAGTPDDTSLLDTSLVRIARLAADLVAPVAYASVTVVRDSSYSTVAMSSEVALAVDEAQYDESSGPCLEALAGDPVSVPDIAATVRWPGFRDQAMALGLRASLSLPLFAGSGVAVAALNLYGRELDAMSSLAPRLRAVFGGAVFGGAATEERADALDPGSAQLVAGFAQAFHVRATIQQALGVLMAVDSVTAARAYSALRLRAAEAGSSLLTTAAEIIRSRAS